MLTFGGSLTLDFGAAAALTSYDLFDIGMGGQTGSFSSVNLAGLYSGNLTNNSGIWTASNGGFQFSFNQSTGDLTVATVPEPSSYLLLAIGASGLCLFRPSKNPGSRRLVPLLPG